jgi:ABC-type oligopeptide transport system substrate-binding subunit
MVSRRSLFATLGLALGLTATAAAEAALPTKKKLVKPVKPHLVKHAKITKPHKPLSKPAAQG